MTYAVFDRHYRWAGCRLGRRRRSHRRRARQRDRAARPAGAAVLAPQPAQNQMLLSSFHLSPATPCRRTSRRCQRFKPAVARRLSVDALPAGQVPADARRDVSAARRGHVVGDAVRLPARGHRRALRVPRLRLLRAGRARRVLGRMRAARGASPRDGVRRWPRSSTPTAAGAARARGQAGRHQPAQHGDAADPLRDERHDRAARRRRAAAAGPAS